MLKEIYDLKTDLQKKGIRGLALDIDETLSFTLKNWFARLSKRFGNPEGLTTNELIKKYRYAKNVPYWQSQEVIDWVIENVYDDDLQEELEVIGEADKYMKELTAIKPVVAYITNRPIEVASGTKRWLEKHKFPNAPLIMKPDFIYFKLANKWKASVLEYLYPQVDCYVDDNFEVIDYLPSNYKGHIFLYDMDKFDSNLKNVHPCPTWKSVITSLKKI